MTIRHSFQIGQGLADVGPFSFAGTVEYGIADFLRFERVAERGGNGFAFFVTCQKIGHLMDEAVFVANLQTGHPPMVHVGMVAIGDVNRSPAAQYPFVAMIEVAEPVQIVQIPGEIGRANV